MEVRNTQFDATTGLLFCLYRLLGLALLSPTVACIACLLNHMAFQRTRNHKIGRVFSQEMHKFDGEAFCAGQLSPHRLRSET